MLAKSLTAVFPEARFRMRAYPDLPDPLAPSIATNPVDGNCNGSVCLSALIPVMFAMEVIEKPSKVGLADRSSGVTGVKDIFSFRASLIQVSAKRVMSFSENGLCSVSSFFAAS